MRNRAQITKKNMKARDLQREREREREQLGGAQGDNFIGQDI